MSATSHIDEVVSCSSLGALTESWIFEAVSLARPWCLAGRGLASSGFAAGSVCSTLRARLAAKALNAREDRDQQNNYLSSLARTLTYELPLSLALTFVSC